MICNQFHIVCRTLTILLLSFPLILTLSSCTAKKKLETYQPSVYEQQLEEENKKLLSEVEKLQQELAGKQDEIKKLILAQQHTTREVVRSKAKLRSHSSKAETVANIAEVKTMLKAASEKAMNEELRQLILDTEQTIALSVAALNKGDIDKAFNLSNKAQQLIQPVRTQQGKNLFNNGADIVFVDPLLMKVTKTCNVRTDPGMQNDILFTLKSGTEIKALAYVENWIQVTSETKGKGWVYYQLLEIVP